MVYRGRSNTGSIRDGIAALRLSILGHMLREPSLHRSLDCKINEEMAAERPWAQIKKEKSSSGDLLQLVYQPLSASRIFFSFTVKAVWNARIPVGSGA